MGIREAIIARAKEFLGTPYKKYDCSAYVRQVFRKWELKKLYKNELPRVSATQAYKLSKLGIGEKIDNSMSVADVIKKLKKGDLVWWWSKKATSRWRRIHHVGIYDQDGYAYESSSSKGKVIRRKLWESTSWQITYIADVTGLIETSGTPIEMEEEEMVINKESDRNDVRDLQVMLKELGYDLGTFTDSVTGEPTGLDGGYGKTGTSYTSKAVMAEQAKAGLEQTGEVDGLTMLAIAKQLKGDTTELEVMQKQVESLARQLAAANDWAIKVKAAVNS